MKKVGAFTNILAVGGTLLVGFPLLAPVFLSLAVIFSEREFRFDYLMPAELFPFALLGMMMLMWAALRAQSRRRWIGWGLVVGLVMLFGGQLLAQVTGLASGAVGPESGWYSLVISTFIVYSLALAGVAVGGGLLLADLAGRRTARPGSP